MLVQTPEVTGHYRSRAPYSLAANSGSDRLCVHIKIIKRFFLLPPSLNTMCGPSVSVHAGLTSVCCNNSINHLFVKLHDLLLPTLNYFADARML